MLFQALCFKNTSYIQTLVYVDCFAGKGKFEDGNDGSPLIALKIISECLDSTISVIFGGGLVETLRIYSSVEIPFEPIEIEDLDGD